MSSRRNSLTKLTLLPALVNKIFIFLQLPQHLPVRRRYSWLTMNEATLRSHSAQGGRFHDRRSFRPAIPSHSTRRTLQPTPLSDMISAAPDSLASDGTNPY